MNQWRVVGASVRGPDHERDGSPCQDAWAAGSFGAGGVCLCLCDGAGSASHAEVGARVAWSGVGRRIRSEHPSPRALRRAIHDVLSDPHYQQAARRIADRIADASGFAGLAGIVDRATQSPCPPTVKSHNPNTTAP